VFKLPRPLHVPDALRLSSLDSRTFRRLRFPDLNIHTRLEYGFQFSMLHESRLSSVIEYAPLRFATLAYLEVARFGVGTINALNFLDQFYVHTRGILTSSAHLKLMHAALLVLSVLQTDGSNRTSLDIVEKELFFTSMIVRCFNSV